MSKKVTLRALDHLLMASLRHHEGNYREAAKHLQLATEQEDFEDTVETLNSANEEGWEEEDDLEDMEEAGEDMDMDADVQDEDDSEVVDSEGELAKVLARVSRGSKRRAVRASTSASDEDEGDDEEVEEDDSAQESAALRRSRAQANLRLLKRK